MWQAAAEGQSDRIASDMEVCMKQRCATEFLHVEKNLFIDIHQHLLSIYGDQKCVASGGDCWELVFCNQVFALSNSVIVLLVSIVVSMEINGRHSF